MTAGDRAATVSTMADPVFAVWIVAIHCNQSFDSFLKCRMNIRKKEMKECVWSLLIYERAMW